MGDKRGYGQFCPVALAAEILTERWTPLIVRELLCGSVRFNDLQRGVPRMSSALLARRLKELQFAGIAERCQCDRAAFEYHLTPAGRELFPVIEKMGLWAQRWLRHDHVNRANFDPDLLMWDIRRNVIGKLRRGQSGTLWNFGFLAFRSAAAATGLFEGGVVDLCYRNPGFDVDLFVEASPRLLTQVWLGHATIDQALRDGLLRLDGLRDDRRAFCSWFALNMFAPAGREPMGQMQVAAE